MKYLILGLAILALMLAFCVFDQQYISMHTAGIYDALAQSLSAMQRGQTASATAANSLAAARWASFRRVASFLLPHSDVEQIDLSMQNLQYAPAEDRPAICAELMTLLQRLTRQRGLSLEDLI